MRVRNDDMPFAHVAMAVEVRASVDVLMLPCHTPQRRCGIALTMVPCPSERVWSYPDHGVTPLREHIVCVCLCVRVPPIHGNIIMPHHS